jgi:CRISPR-associated endonuclease Cas1
MPPVTSDDKPDHLGGTSSMAARSTLTQQNISRKSPISKSGVLTIHGFGVRVRMQSGHLEIEDGTGQERRSFRLPRVGHRLTRLVCVSEDGFITLSALKWMSDQKASFTMLDRCGKIALVTGPTAPSDARLRRAQALAHQTGKALEISRELIRVKLEGQERLVAEQLKQPSTANGIGRLRQQLRKAVDLDTIRYLEAQAARTYWNAWSEVPVLFPHKDLKRVPDHWLRFGTRHSPLTGGPRLAINPPNAILSYCFALGESECRLALSACGLDPGLAFIHADAPARDSLALDLLETIRPSIEAWLLNWVTREPLRRSDFFETGSGNCRLMFRMCSQLSETAPTWGRLVAPWAEYVAHALWVGRSSSSRPATPLTQRHKREAKGKITSFVIAPPVPEKVCLGCGKAIAKGSTHCAVCIVEVSRTRMLELARKGRIASKSPESLARVSETQRHQALAWRRWDPSSKPEWLTKVLYNDKIKPVLLQSSISQIAGALKVSIPYAANIRLGKRRPHPRHWQLLAQLVGFKPRE